MNKNVNGKNTDSVDSRFVVISGPNAGSQFTLLNGESLSAGGGIENDIVVQNIDADTWSVNLENSGQSIQLKVVEGEVERNGELLKVDTSVLAKNEDVFKVAGTTFRIHTGKNNASAGNRISNTNKELIPPLHDHTTGKSKKDGNNQLDSTDDVAVDSVAEYSPTEHSDSKQLEADYRKVPEENGIRFLNTRSLTRNLVFGLSVCTIALGAVTAISAVTAESSHIKGFEGNNESSLFDKKMKQQKFDSVSYELLDDGQTYLVSGIVDSRDHRNRLLEIAGFTDTKIKLDLQVNDELIESVEDIYRVSGIRAEAEVAGRGHIKVLTHTDNIEKLASVEQSVKNDIPALTSLEVINDPPEAVVLDTPQKIRENPDKRITLVVTGDNPYLMTKDKSRYFLGAILPSGHVVESIKDGIVVVSMDGKQETLKY